MLLKVKICRQTEVKSVTVPGYPELSVKSFGSIIKKITKYLAYFPDYKPSHLPELDFIFETFFYNLHTICD